MTQQPIYFTLVDAEGGLQKKSFLLDIDYKYSLDDKLSSIADTIYFIPGYSGAYEAYHEDKESYKFKLFGKLVVPQVNFIGSLVETLEALLRIEFHRSGIEFADLRLSSFQPSNTIPLDFVFDPISNIKPTPSISWTHSNLYKQDCFSCQMGVRELMNAIEYCKGKIIIDKPFSLIGMPHVVLEPSDDIENEFVKWFTSSFQGTLEAAHVDVINFITPTRTISKKLGY